MTATVQARVPGRESGHLALRRLVAGDLDRFAGRTWGREPLLSRADDLPRPFDDLLGPGAVDELVSRRGLRTPFLRVAKNGSTLAERAFTAGGGTGAGIGDQVSDDKLVRLFAEGATMVLQGLHRVWSPLIDFTQQLAADLGHPVQANAYVTPPQSRGFDDHYDVHDVFVLQTEGEKRWLVRPPVHRSPLRDQPWTDRRSQVAAAAQADPLLDVVLRSGDCLYLPSGYLHAATALGGVSTHLTIGVHTWTRHAVAQELVRAALELLGDDEQVRASLALGVNVQDGESTSDDLELVRSRLLRAVRDVPTATVAGAMAARDRGTQRAAPVGPLAQLRAASTLGEQGVSTLGEQGDGAYLRLRPHLAATLDTSGLDTAGLDTSAHAPVLRSRAGDLTLEPAERSVVERLLDGEPVAIAEAGATVSRRLLLAGVAVRS